MKRKNVLTLLLELVFLVVFNLVFFVVGSLPHKASVWISYVCIHFAYLMVLATPFLNRKNLNPSIFGVSLESISATYFFVEFVVGLFFILIARNWLKACLVSQIVIAGIYAAILLIKLITNEQTADKVAKREAEVAYIKNAASELKALVGKTSDKKANKAIEKAYDAVHASPVKSSATVEETEKRISCTVAELSDAVKRNDATYIIALANEIIELTNKRNQQLSLEN